MNTSVTAKCIGCGAKRQIAAGEVLPGDHPHCEKCFMPMVAVGARIATIETQALAQEWAEDPEAMSEERREALLDVVRDVMDRNVSGVSFAHGVTMVTRGFGFLDLNTKPRRTYFTEEIIEEVESFGLTAADARALCEEAGLPS